MPCLNNSVKIYLNSNQKTQDVSFEWNNIKKPINVNVDITSKYYHEYFNAKVKFNIVHSNNNFLIKNIKIKDIKFKDSSSVSVSDKTDEYYYLYNISDSSSNSNSSSSSSSSSVSFINKNIHKNIYNAIKT